ncbi:MAG: O-antigen ligase family protein [Mycobacterium sp.]|uniref:O-antigen ligase family protein n=1 Tax=Mycobacterium sp. TaxID=1785 RepID=UPI003F9B4B3B
MTRKTDPKTGGSELGAWLAAAAALAASVVVVAAVRLPGAKFGQLLVLGAVALVLGVMVLRSAPFATIILIIAIGLAPATPHVLPIDTFWIVFAGVVGALVLWMQRNPDRPRGMDAIEWAIALYMTWNVYSMISPHEYMAAGEGTTAAMAAGVASGQIHTSAPVVVWRLIVVKMLLPLVLYRVGRSAFDRAAVVRALLWAILILAAYSAVMSIMQFSGPTELVWPRYMLDPKNWPGRAAGVFRQPVVNGWLLALGLTIAMLLLSRRSEPTWLRWFAFVVAIACGYGIFLTHTRDAWISGVVVLIIGALIARGYRKGFIVAICLVASVVAVNWSTFTSSDRKAGGVGSMNEVHDRLNADQTALWAFERKPVAGWGIGRFHEVNTYHHQQWAPDVPWIRGYGIVAHSHDLGILAELGVIGLALWICVAALTIRRLWTAYRTLPDHDLCGKPLAVTAIMALATLLCAGLTVDLRMFDFPMLPIFLLAGITIGWSDRYQRSQTAAGGEIAEPVGEIVEPLGELVEPVLVRHG